MCSQMLGEPESPVVMQLVEMVAVLSAVLHEELSSETVAVPQSGEDT